MTTRGKHRRSFWLGVGPVVVMLLALALALAPNASAEYGGSRWQHAARPICVTTKYINTTAVKDAVKRSVAVWRDNTVLDVRIRSNCYASGYSQRIVVYDRKYGTQMPFGRSTVNASGVVEFKGGYKAFQPKTTGPWLSGSTWAWAHQSPVIVRINRTYTDGSYNHRQHTVSHELGHALGLGHNQKCSIMTVNKACKVYLYGGGWDWDGTESNPGINRIYGKG